MTDVGRSTWNKGWYKGEKYGVKKEKINSAIYYAKSLMENNITLEEAIITLKMDENLAKIVRRNLSEK